MHSDKLKYFDCNGGTSVGQESTEKTYHIFTAQTNILCASIKSFRLSASAVLSDLSRLIVEVLVLIILGVSFWILKTADCLCSCPKPLQKGLTPVSCVTLLFKVVAVLHQYNLTNLSLNKHTANVRQNIP